MIYRYLLTLLLLTVAAPIVNASEEPAPGLPLPALSTMAADISAERAAADATARGADRVELVDCFYDWNKNDPACTADSSTKSARP